MLDFGTSGTADPGAFTVGQADSYAFPVTGGGTFAWSVTSGSLPGGLTLDPATGVLAGTPLSGTVGSYPVTVHFEETFPFGISPAAGDFPVTIVVQPVVTGGPANAPISAQQFAAGSTQTLSGTGLVSGTVVTVVLHSTPVTLGSTTADTNGAFSITVTIPQDTAVGAHTLSYTLAPPGGAPTLTYSDPITVSAAVASATGPSATGPSATGPSASGPSTTGPSTTSPSATDPSTTSLAFTGVSAGGPFLVGMLLLLLGAGFGVAARVLRRKRSRHSPTSAQPA